MRPTTALALVALCGIAPVALGQQAASARLRPVPGEVRHARFVLTDAGLVPAGRDLFGGIVVGSVYVNDCGTGQVYAALAPGERFVDTGQVPADDNPDLLCLTDAISDRWLIDGFEVGYCSDQATVDLAVDFWDLVPSCTDPTGAPPAASFVLGGLPGSTGGGVVCWTVNVALDASQEFELLDDGDGTWDGDAALDTFGVSFAITNLAAGDTAGILVAGDPVHLGAGCEFGVGTIFEGPEDVTGSDPHGTGYGTVDRFGVVAGGAFVGCFDLGGWPSAPWASFHLRLDSPYDCILPGFGLCDGTGDGPWPPCPCGNASTEGNEGCVHTGGFGARLDVGPGGPSFPDLQLVATDLPPGNGGVFLVGTVPTSGVAVFDGLTCVGGSTLRLNAGFETAPGVRLSGDDGALGPSLVTEGNAASPGYFTPGSSYVFAYWFRDVNAGPSPCGGGANFTPSGEVFLF